MTLCVKTGYQCVCQPDEGVFCPDYKPDAYVQCLMDAITELRALQSETALTDEKGRPMTYWGGAPSHDKKDDAWRSAALRLGEQLAPTGPNWYYAMTPTQWLEWCQSALPSAVARSDEWRAAALRLGEQLTTTGPNGYYSMTPTQWLDWCENSLPSAIAPLLKAIDDEPEFPGEMPDEMWDAIKGDRDAVQEAMRIAVRLTKSGIRDRVTNNAADSRSAK